MTKKKKPTLSFKKLRRLSMAERVQLLKERCPGPFRRGREMIERVRVKRLLEEQYDVDVDG